MPIVKQKEKPKSHAFESFMKGITHIFGGYKWKSSFQKRVLERSDAEALRSDWVAVGNDLRTAMGKTKKQK